MAKNMYVICEGQSENAFVRELLIPYVGEKSGWMINLWPTTVITSRNRRAGRIYRGGILGYEKAKSEIKRCMSTGNYVTTMFDFYALPNDFPGYTDAVRLTNDHEKTLILESALHDDIISMDRTFESDRFIPYIQLHEFEALIYTDLSALKQLYLSKEDHNEIDKLILETEGMMPEDINDSPETAPSKRLLERVNYKKGNSVIYPLKTIGIDTIRKKCPHFDAWLKSIEDL